MSTLNIAASVIMAQRTRLPARGGSDSPPTVTVPGDSDHEMETDGGEEEAECEGSGSVQQTRAERRYNRTFDCVHCSYFGYDADSPVVSTVGCNHQILLN